MNQKKFLAIKKRLGQIKELSEDERTLFARSLASTPDERWKVNEDHLRSLNLLKPDSSPPKKKLKKSGVSAGLKRASAKK